MTLDQLRVFVAVAERQHLTAGARAVHLTPPAATAAIQALEGRHGTALFHRVGRRLELTADGRAFLPEARNVLSAVEAATAALEERSGLKRGRLTIAASQTLAGHWLPPVLMRFAEAHGGIVLDLSESNTAGVVAAVLAGDAELGCLEGEVHAPALAVTPLAVDRLLVVGAPHHPLARDRAVAGSALLECRWVLREPGSGTRAVFEAALRADGIEPSALNLILTLPSNEAVCAAASRSECLTVVSELVAQPHIEAGRLQRIRYPASKRSFVLVRHKERHRSRAAVAFEAMLRDEAQALLTWQGAPDYEI